METVKREYEALGPAGRLWLKAEKAVNRVLSSECNPFYYLGAISVFFLWTILVTGIYLFLFYDISARGAYASVQALTVNQWYLGGVMRSLHRYASDGLVIATILHAARTFFLDRYKHWRRVAWVSGVFILWICIAAGIFGYWMVWDERARLIATFSAHMLENIPIFGIPLSLNFARVENLTDQLFYIVLFIHFSSVFFLFILIMIHILKITKAVINPPRTVAYGLIIALFVLAALKPAGSAPSAEMKILAASVPFDWFYMFIFPLLKFMKAHELWFFILGATAVFAAVPWLTRSKRKPAAEVKLENCTGCELCMEDCPYQAIVMRKRTDGAAYPLEAVVIPKRCASCGLCAGACDYSAINLPDITEESVKNEIKRVASGMKASKDGPNVFVFACANGAWLDGKTDLGGRIGAADWARGVALPCIGMLQPSMISLAVEKGADGVFIGSCKQADCHFRRGAEWHTGRLSGFRPPVLKRSVDRSLVRTVYLSSVEKREFHEALNAFRGSLKAKRSE